MIINIHATYMDTKETINQEVDLEFFKDLEREMDIHALTVDGEDLSEIASTGYSNIIYFLEAYEGGDLKYEVTAYMACMAHGLAMHSDDAIDYVHKNFIKADYIDNHSFVSEFSYSKAVGYIGSIVDSRKAREDIERYFNFASYEKDL